MFLRKYGINVCLHIIAQQDRRFPHEQLAIGIIISAILRKKWPTSFAELVMLRDRARMGHDVYQEQLAEYRLLQKCTLSKGFFLEESRKEKPEESPLFILAHQTDSDIQQGLQKMNDGGFILITTDSIVIPTTAFFSLLLEGCRKQQHLIPEAADI